MTHNIFSEYFRSLRYFMRDKLISKKYDLISLVRFFLSFYVFTLW